MEGKINTEILGYFDKLGERHMLTSIDGDGNLEGFRISPKGKIQTMSIHEKSVDSLVLIQINDGL